MSNHEIFVNSKCGGFQSDLGLSQNYDSAMVFHGFWLVSMVFQVSLMVFGWFPWVFEVVSWFLLGFHDFQGGFMVFHGFWLVSMVFEGFQVDFHCH